MIFILLSPSIPYTTYMYYTDKEKGGIILSENRSSYKKKRRNNRKLKEKAKIEEERTHGKFYNITMGVLIGGLFILFAYPPNLAIAVLSVLLLTSLTIVFFGNQTYKLSITKDHKGELIQKKKIVALTAFIQILLSYLFGIISAFLVVTFFELLPFQLPGKTGFNVFIITTLLMSFLFYYFYTKYEVGHKIFQKTALKEKRMIEAIKEEEYQKLLLNMTDVFAIGATVLLLANSTASLAYPTEETTPDELLSIFESRVLIMLLAVYVPAIYLRIANK